jgi:hypothetical protein
MPMRELEDAGLGPFRGNHDTDSPNGIHKVRENLPLQFLYCGGRFIYTVLAVDDLIGRTNFVFVGPEGVCDRIAEQLLVGAIGSDCGHDGLFFIFISAVPR